MEYSYQLPATSQLYRQVVSPGCDWLCLNVIPAKVTPNQLTFLGWAFAALAWLAVEQNLWLVAAICWFLYGISDNCDGKQARLRKLSSAAGDYLDHVVDSYVCTFLALITIAAFLPNCHQATSFSFAAYLRNQVSCESVQIAPFLVTLGISQVPFYIGCWSHHVNGRLLLGRKENSRLTVDEINLLLVPGMCIARYFLPFLFTASHPALQSVTASLRNFGADCAGSNGDARMTVASAALAFSLVYSGVQSARIAYRLLRTRQHLDYFAILVCYITSICFIPLPPLVLVPAFAALCSSGIFDRSRARYFKRAPESDENQFIKYINRLPSLSPWQTHKTFPLIWMVASSMLIRSTWSIAPSLAPGVTIAAMIGYCLGFLYILRLNVHWLNAAEKEVQMFRSQR